MTSRKREAPVVTMHVRSANVLRENTESRRSLDSSEKNRLNIENTTTPMVRAMASVCACSAQLTTLSVPIAITSPTETSQARTPPVRIGWPGGRGRRGGRSGRARRSGGVSPGVDVGRHSGSLGSSHGQ